MEVQVLHATVHTSEQVREIIAEAERIADASPHAADEWPAVFAQACQLLGARATVVGQPSTPVTARLLDGIRAGGV